MLNPFVGATACLFYVLLSTDTADNATAVHAVQLDYGCVHVLLLPFTSQYSFCIVMFIQSGEHHASNDDSVHLVHIIVHSITHTTALRAARLHNAASIMNVGSARMLR
jgi:hypothetical protein